MARPAKPRRQIELKAQKNPPPGRVLEIFDDHEIIADLFFLSTLFLRVGKTRSKPVKNGLKLLRSALFCLSETMFYRANFIGAMLLA